MNLAGPKQQLAAHKATIAALQARLHAAIAEDAGLTAFRKWVPLQPTDLPPPVLPADERQVKACGLVYQILDRWQTGGCVPFAWSALKAQAVVDAGEASGALALVIAKTVLGPAWVKFYGSGDPAVTDIVPQQVAQSLVRQLTALKAQYGEGEGEAAADQAYQAIRDGAKRFRVSPPGADT